MCLKLLTLLTIPSSLFVPVSVYLFRFVLSMNALSQRTCSKSFALPCSHPSRKFSTVMTVGISCKTHNKFRASPELHHTEASVFIWWCSAGLIKIGSDSLLLFRFFGHSNQSSLPLLIASSITIISCSEIFVDNGLLWLPARRSLVITQSCSHDDDAFNCEGRRAGTNFNLVVTKKK